MKNQNQTENGKRVDEGIGLFQDIISWFYAPSLNRKLDKIINDLTGDKEFKASVESYKFHRDQAAKVLKDYCKKYPKSEMCSQGHKSRIFR